MKVIIRHANAKSSLHDGDSLKCTIAKQNGVGRDTKTARRPDSTTSSPVMDWIFLSLVTIAMHLLCRAVAKCIESGSL